LDLALAPRHGIVWAGAVEIVYIICRRLLIGADVPSQVHHVQHATTRKEVALKLVEVPSEEEELSDDGHERIKPEMRNATKPGSASDYVAKVLNWGYVADG